MLNMILLPGMLCDEALWQHQIKALSSKISLQIPVLTEYKTIHTMAMRVLEAAPASFILGGLSMGGYIALEIMRLAPERVEKLILLDTSARSDTEEQKRRRYGLMALAKRGAFKGVTPRLLPTLLHPDHLNDSRITQPLLDMALRIGRDAYLNQQSAIAERVDSRPFLKKILCPTLIMAGDQDAMTPPDIAREMSDLIPNAHLEIIRQAGHLPPLEQPLQVTKLIEDFLRIQGRV